MRKYVLAAALLAVGSNASAGGFDEEPTRGRTYQEEMAHTRYMKAMRYRRDTIRRQRFDARLDAMLTFEARMRYDAIVAGGFAHGPSNGSRPAAIVIHQTKRQ
jgi:hypothetical protein